MSTATTNGPVALDREPAAKAKQPPAQRPRRATRVSKFPFQFHFAINIPMQRSLERLTGLNSLWDSAQIGRMALHQWLVQNDPGYREEVSGNTQ